MVDETTTTEITTMINRATLVEHGNGLPTLGDYVAGDARDVESERSKSQTYRSIHQTHKARMLSLAVCASMSDRFWTQVEWQQTHTRRGSMVGFGQMLLRGDLGGAIAALDKGAAE